MIECGPSLITTRCQRRIQKWVPERPKTGLDSNPCLKITSLTNSHSRISSVTTQPQDSEALKPANSRPPILNSALKQLLAISNKSLISAKHLNNFGAFKLQKPIKSYEYKAKTPEITQKVNSTLKLESKRGRTKDIYKGWTAQYKMFKANSSKLVYEMKSHELKFRTIKRDAKRTSERNLRKNKSVGSFNGLLGRGEKAENDKKLEIIVISSRNHHASTNRLY